MLTLHFGSDFDSPLPATQINAGEVYLGPKNLLRFLETHLGCGGYPENTDYLRIELYRQSLSQNLQMDPDVFYGRSFEADRFATATALLLWRDELLLAGWDFSATEETPVRLATFADVEQIFRKKLNEPPSNIQALGFADRFDQALQLLANRLLPINNVIVHDPVDLLPAHIQRFLNIISTKKINVDNQAYTERDFSESNLDWLKKRLAGQERGKKDNHNDGSLLILRARRDVDVSVFLAQTLARNRSMKPVFFVPDMSLTLDLALMQEGFPAMGILSASSARPSLQVLKLAPVFLWEPVDVFKILEFVTLPVKPLDDGLAAVIGKALAAKPGLFSDNWFAAVYSYLEDANVDENARKQYEFWFNRPRYRADAFAPKRDIIGVYNYLREWAVTHFEKTNGKNPTLLVLAEQARRISDLLEAIPELRLSFLDLERIVRTIYQPAPFQLAPPEKQHFEYAHAPGAFIAPTESLIWWNCIYNDPTPSPDKWTPSERKWLDETDIHLSLPKQQIDLRLFLRNRPVFAAHKQLILVVPENVDGKETLPSLLLGDIEAAFKNHGCFTYDLESPEHRAKLAEWMALPFETTHESLTFSRTKPHLSLNRPEAVGESEYETLTSLDSLLYYPHTWFFKQKMRLFPSSILSVTGDHTLLGNLSHRFFELLLQEQFADWDKQMVHDWIQEQSEALLEKEGATLLLYGREPEKNKFISRVKNAAWSLVSLLRSNGWQVMHTEYKLEGAFVDMPIRGKADLVLQRGDEIAIIDLKWSGANRRKEMIKNGEDLQLVLYAWLFPPPEKWPHTGYFILEEGKMVARNNLAFKEAIIAQNNADHALVNAEILARMEKTYLWRKAQLRKGLLEIRTQHTVSELDFLYAEELMDLLEMKREDARWDDYRTLIRI